MGVGNSTQKQILQKAQKFKLDLYQRVQKFRDKHSQQIRKIDPKLKQKVILSSACQLVQMLQNKQVTSQQLVLIFAQRASTIGIKNNYVFDQMFQQALQQAKKCDQARRANPTKRNWKGDILNKEKSFPPFYGIPASYKQNIVLKNRTNHAGYIIPHQKNYYQQQNGLFAQITIRMGFIPFVRTNVPMSCKTSDTHNFIFGYCKNPWNNQRSCGGSSGGQGGLIGAYCSPIGFGSDIGGSLRIPAEWNGLVTLKHANRFSRMGNCFYGKITGGIPIKSDLGPITRSTKDIELFMKYICDEQNYQGISKNIMDPYLNLKPWNQKQSNSKKKLKIGYIMNLDTLDCSLTNQRVVNEAVEILRNQGHDLKEIKLTNFQQGYFGLMQLFTADGSSEALTEISPNENLIPQFKLLRLSTKIPNFVKNILLYFVQNKQPRWSKILKSSKSLTVNDTFKKLYEMQTQLSNQFYHYFIDNDIDAILMPGFAHPSIRFGTMPKYQYSLVYTVGWNIVNYPAGVVPMGLVQQNQQIYQDTYNDMVTQNMKQCMKQSKGLPVGVQIASLPYKQEIVLNIMSQLEEKVQFRKKYPCKKILEQQQ